MIPGRSYDCAVLPEETGRGSDEENRGGTGDIADGMRGYS